MAEMSHAMLVAQAIRRGGDCIPLGLSDAGRETVDLLLDDELWGGAIAYHANPCIVIYGVPVWIMPNGKVRVGEPNAPMIETVHDAVQEVKRLRDERMAAGEVRETVRSMLADWDTASPETKARMLAEAEAKARALLARMLSEEHEPC